MSYPESIVKGNFEQATNDELRRVIITIDGLGKKVQEKALEELLKREYERGQEQGMKECHVFLDDSPHGHGRMVPSM